MSRGRAVPATGKPARHSPSAIHISTGQATRIPNHRPRYGRAAPAVRKANAIRAGRPGSSTSRATIRSFLREGLMGTVRQNCQGLMPSSFTTRIMYSR